VKSFLITPGAEGDLPGIVDVLNFTIMNSNATLVAEPVSAADEPVHVALAGGQERPVPELGPDGALLPAPLAADAGPGDGPQLAHRNPGEQDSDPEQQDHQADDLRLELRTGQ
jgi:hypothetical protein